MRWWTRSTENSSPALWHAAQLSPRMVVLARAWEAVATSSWQPWQAAEMGGVGVMKAPGLATETLAPTFSTKYVLSTWQVLQFRKSPGNLTSW